MEDEIKLPELPFAIGWAGHLFEGGPKCEIYTAEQMQAYASAYGRLVAEACIAKCKSLAESQDPKQDIRYEMGWQAGTTDCLFALRHIAERMK